MIHVRPKSAHLIAYNPNEFSLMVDSLGFSLFASWLVPLYKPHQAHFLGSGILDALKSFCEQHHIKTIFINQVLSPRHQSELEKKLCVHVKDRNQLILELFKSRAHSYEGKLQVELAQYAYLSTRLVRGWTHLERQRGGVGLRGGPGETQLEIDKRLLAERIRRTKQKLTKFQKHRDLTLRKRHDTFSINLVGYTNAGKSTLFEAIAQKKAYHDDRLFATLDPLSSVVQYEKNRFVLTDTVGFIEHLPETLMTAFKATLSEMDQADLLCIVLDLADPNYKHHLAVIHQVIEDLHLTHIPSIYVFNKIDRVNIASIDHKHREKIRSYYVSAQTGEGLAALKAYLFNEASLHTIRRNKRQ